VYQISFKSAGVRARLAQVTEKSVDAVILIPQGGIRAGFQPSNNRQASE
jgi:hypothetical protein